eukprot:147352-Prymnesium_polylepis.1
MPQLCPAAGSTSVAHAGSAAPQAGAAGYGAAGWGTGKRHALVVPRCGVPTLWRSALSSA